MSQRTAFVSAPKADRTEIQYSWLDNPDIQKLLDIISEIIANEYIEVARKNKDIFGVASGTSCPRNDDGGGK